jgi:hypothetical protein
MGELVSGFRRGGRAGFADHRGGPHPEPPGPVRHRRSRWDALDVLGRRLRLGELVPDLGWRRQARLPDHGGGPDPDHLDLYVTGTDRRIYTTHLRADATWQRWSPVPWFTTASGAWITAVPRTADQLDLFATSEQAGAIYSTALPFECELFPPRPPTDLRVTEVADRRIAVAWKDRSNNETGFVLNFRGKRPRNLDHTGSQSLPANTEAASISGLRSGYEYAIHVVAVNEAGESGGPSVTATTPARTVSVAKEGAGSSTVFVVKGRGFSPNSKVVLRIEHGLTQSEWVETAEADGTLTSRRSYPCVTGQGLNVYAFEDADPESTVSNILETSCP